MRHGQNPAKFIDQVHQPQSVTVAVVTYIPFLSGYYADSLKVLKACLGSIWQNTDLPYDLLVFDNASCEEVRQYLQEAHRQGKIQYLVLSQENVGKAGAWNFIFGAAPGETIAYADSDIYFYPGWLSAQLKVLQTLPQVGMVTGMPLRTPEQFSTATVAWAESAPDVSVERGPLLAWEDYWRHSRSLGASQEQARQQYDTTGDVRVTYQGLTCFVGAGHFQFVAPKAVLQQVLPIPSRRPMGQVRLLDVAINEAGYRRFSTSQWWVRHLGNTLEGEDSGAAEPVQAGETVPRQEAAGRWQKLFQWKPVRRVLLAIYDRIFGIYFRTV